MIETAGDPTLKNVEIINVKNAGGVNNLNLGNSSGVEQVWSDGSVNGAINFKATPELVTLGARDTEGTSANVNYAAGVVKASDTQNIVLDNADVNMDVAQGAAATGVENVSIASEGEENSVKFTKDLVSGNAVQNLEITGAGDLRVVDNNSGITAGTVDASAATGDVSLTISDESTANLATGVTERTVTMGAGDDTVDATAGLADNKIDGGAGRDTLVVNATTATNLVGDLVGNISNFEVLSLGNMTSTSLDAGTLLNADFEALSVTGATTGASLDNLPAGADVTLNGTNTIALNVKDADQAGDTAFSFATVGQENADTTQAVTAADVQNLTVSTSDADEDNFNTTTLTLTDAALENLTVTGDEAVVFDGSTGFGNLETVNVSGITAESDASLSTPEYAAEIKVADANVVGSAGDDKITFGTDAVVKGGEGNDLFVAGSGAAANGSDVATIADFQQGDVIKFDEAVASVESALTESDLNLPVGKEVEFTDYTTAATGDNDNALTSFEFGGNTYMVLDGSSADTIIELSGSVDLTGLETENATTQTVEIA